MPYVQLFDSGRKEIIHGRRDSKLSHSCPCDSMIDSQLVLMISIDAPLLKEEEDGGWRERCEEGGSVWKRGGERGKVCERMRRGYVGEGTGGRGKE